MGGDGRPRNAGVTGSGAGTVAKRRGALAGRRQVAGQVIGDLEPGELFAHEGMPGGWPLRRILERAVQEVDFAWPTRTRVGHRRAAGATKIALHAGRGGVGGGLARKVAELLEPDADVGRKWRRHGAPTTCTMAMHHPLRCALELIGDGAALTTAPGGAQRREPSLVMRARDRAGTVRM